MMDQNSYEELKHDQSQKELTLGEIADRVDAILGDCQNPESGYYGVIEEAIHEDAAIIEQVMKMAWYFKPFKDVNKTTYEDVRHMALQVQVIVDRINKIAEKYAIEELSA